MEEPFTKRPNSGEPWDVVVIGSGPAGLTAGVYTTRGSASTLIAGGEVWGGQLMLTSTVDNFPGFPEGIQGPDLMLNMRKQVERFGGVFLEKNVEKIDFSQKPFSLVIGGENFLAKTIIIATGAETVWLDVPGIKELIGKGVSSCAPCDAPFFKDKVVGVVGGGDSAMEEAFYLTKYASQIYVIHRRDKFRAAPIMQQKILNNPKIKILWNSEVTQVKGEQKLEGITLKNNKDGNNQELKLDGLFMAIGHRPLSEIFKGQIDLDEKGFIKISGGHSKTNIPGVFVAGDVMDPYYKQAATAAGSGCAAAMDTLKFLDEEKD
jgi:thioredoxin reductase (NADPH)